MRERMFLIAYRRELGAEVVFPQPTHWADLPPGYDGTRAVALKLLNQGGLFGAAHSYIEQPEPPDRLRRAVTAEEAIGDLPPIFARRELADGSLKRGARRFDAPMRYLATKKLSVYARMMRNWKGFEAPEHLTDHVIRYLPRDYEIFARMRPGDQYPQAWQLAHTMLAERIEQLARDGKMVRPNSSEYRRIEKAIVPPYGAMPDFG
jgi:DNA (cytosine-5)-methyltransferase 1